MKVIDLRQSADLTIPRPETGDEPENYVREIVERVRSQGDQALIDLAREFDGVDLTPESLRVSEAEIDVGLSSISKELRAAIDEAASRIRKFAEHQVIPEWNDSIGGGLLGEVVEPVERAGLYAPGGRAVYPSVVLMGAVPASVAGVQSVALCVPPASNGGVPAPTLAAAAIAGVSEIYRVGGPQAIAAMAYGTKTIKKVSVIAGGGGLLVALAKKEVAGVVAIDSVAGPSEIAIIADETADALTVTCDLIAQAEHGPHGSFVLLTWDEQLFSDVQSNVKTQLDNVQASSDLRSDLEEGLVIAQVSGADQALQ
ncbi:MAG: histidinol dehydrogenase, partial [Acidimicrobiia bacterium]